MSERLLGIATLALCLAALLSRPASAAVAEENFQLRTAADLVAMCSAERGDRLAIEATHFCQGFVVGVYRTLQDEQAALPAKLFCPAGPAPTRSEAIARFVAWARAQPDVLQQKPEDAVLAYLRVRFPCAAGQ